MHSLEYLLFVLSHRIKSGEFSANQLADECLGLASASHLFIPEVTETGFDPDKDLAMSDYDRIYRKWHKKQQKKLKYDEPAAKAYVSQEDRARAHCKTVQHGHHIDTLARDSYK